MVGYAIMTEFIAHNDYRDALHWLITERRARFKSRYTFTRVADAMSVQRAYLSTVLKGQGHLSDDQLFLACRYLNLNAGEAAFLTTLHQLNRSTCKERRNRLMQNLTELRDASLRTESHIAVAHVADDDARLADYYLDPLAQVIHMFLTLPAYRKDLAMIASDLGIAVTKVREILETLATVGLVTVKGETIEVHSADLHLPRDHRLYHAQRRLMQTFAADFMNRLPSERGYGLSACFSTDGETQQWIQSRLLEVLAEIKVRVDQSVEKGVYHLSCNFFPMHRPNRQSDLA